MNAAISNQIIINRQNKVRTLIADKNTMSGVTSDMLHVSFRTNDWKWINVDTDEVVEVAHVIWTSALDETE